MVQYISTAQTMESVDSYKRGAGELSQMKGWSDKIYDVQGHRPVMNGTELLDQADCDDDDAKMSSMSSFLPNASGTAVGHDSQSAEKLQFSSFMSPQVGGLNSFIGENHQEAYPCITSKKIDGQLQ